jgi:hypothetical protein
VVCLLGRSCCESLGDVVSAHVDLQVKDRGSRAGAITTSEVKVRRPRVGIQCGIQYGKRTLECEAKDFVKSVAILCRVV